MQVNGSCCDVAPDEPAITEQETMAELERILSDPEFRSTERNRKFLRYVTETARRPARNSSPCLRTVFPRLVCAFNRHIKTEVAKLLQNPKFLYDLSWPRNSAGAITNSWVTLRAYDSQV
jgi:hypothetical protein